MWGWLTRYDPRQAEGRELILRWLADSGASIVVWCVFLPAGAPILRGITAGRPWWPDRARVELPVFAALILLSALLTRLARRRLSDPA